MSDESNALLALKNAWNGAIAAADGVRDLAPTIAALPPDTHIDQLDLETYHRVTMAQANAVMALRGLVEQLERKKTPGDVSL